MAISQVNVSSPSNEIIYNSTDMGLAEGIKSSSAVVFAVTIDNTANVAASYVKLFNLASGSVTLGSTTPDEVIYVPAGVISTVVFYTGANPGKTFGTALTAACVTTGGTTGNTPPSSDVAVTINYQ